MKMTLANGVTIFRLFLLVPTLFFLLNDQREVSLILLGLVLLGDLIDGAIARSRHEESELGRILDPLVDKIVFAAVFIVLVMLEQLSWIALAALLFYQIGILVGGVLWLRARRDSPPVRTLGKVASFILSIAVLAAVIEIQYSETAVYIAVAFMYVAGFDYLFNLIRVSKEESRGHRHQRKAQIQQEEGT